MDALTVLFLLVVTTLAVWTVRTVRRAGVRRFTGAFAALVTAVAAAVLKLFKFNTQSDKDFIHVIEDLRIAREAQKLSEEGTLGPHDTDDSYQASSKTL